MRCGWLTTYSADDPSCRPYVFMWMDALTQKVREGAQTVNVHALIATGVNADGYREIRSAHARLPPGHRPVRRPVRPPLRNARGWDLFSADPVLGEVDLRWPGMTL
jgi:Transposase, Mutator family